MRCSGEREDCMGEEVARGSGEGERYPTEVYPFPRMISVCRGVVPVREDVALYAVPMRVIVSAVARRAPRFSL